MQDLALTTWSPSRVAAIPTSVQGFLAFFRSALPVDDIVPRFSLWSVSILSASSLPMLFNVVYHDCPFQYCVVFQHKAPFRFDSVDGDVQELEVFVAHLAVTVLSYFSLLSQCDCTWFTHQQHTLVPIVPIHFLATSNMSRGQSQSLCAFPIVHRDCSHCHRVWQTLIAWSDNWLYSTIEYVSPLSLKNFLWMKEGALCMADSESWLMRMLLITEPLITY